MKVAAVVPTCRGFAIPSQSIPVNWYIVHDRERWPVTGLNSFAKHIVAPDPEVYGSYCDSIRSAGFRAAVHDGADYVLTVDDDCKIPMDWAESHVKALEKPQEKWFHTVETLPTRGMPYEAKAKVALSHGLWSGVPDLDAKTQLELGEGFRLTGLDGKWRRIGVPFAQSAMNFGFSAEVLPVMYQPAQGKGSPFDRFADIWGGLLAQRVLSHHGYAYVNGGAVVEHKRASDAEVNLGKERPGISCHERFWRYVWAFNRFGGTIVSSYLRLSDHVQDFEPGDDEWKNYFARLSRNMRTWVDSTERLSRLSSHATSGRQSSSGHSGASDRPSISQENSSSPRPSNVSLRTGMPV